MLIVNLTRIEEAEMAVEPVKKLKAKATFYVDLKYVGAI